jgi:hypothetical protein
MRTCASCRRRRKRKPATNHRSAAGRPSLSRGRGAGRADPDEGVQYRQALRRAGHGRFPTAAQEARDLIRRDYPRIAARAKAEGGAIFWGDGTGLRSDDVRGRGHAPRGRTPEVRVDHRRADLGLISAVTDRGELRRTAPDGAATAPSLIRFLARLVRGAGRKVFLILDRPPVHRSAEVRA